MGKSAPRPKVTEYYMSILMGVCHGAVDSLRAVYFDEKAGFTGDVRGGQQLIELREGELFGGNRKEGGVRGRIFWQNGTNTQKLAAVPAEKLGGTPDTLPAHRGVATAFFTGLVGERRNGFYWRANQPQIPPVWFTVTRLFATWYAEKKSIPNPDFILDSDSTQGFDAQLNAGATPAEGLSKALVFSGFDPDEEIQIQMTGGWSPFGIENIDPAKPLNSGSRNRLRVAIDGDINQIVDFGTGAYNSFAEAGRGFGTQTLTGGESYHIFLQDTPIEDNTYSDDFSIRVTGASRGVDMNPAHIIYEVLTNTTWGMGAPTSSIDDLAFRYAADVLYDEGFGLSFAWMEQTEIYEIVQEVLDHIEATLYIDRETGLFVLKLIRDDYDAENLVILDTSNCELEEVTRRSVGDLINEITTTWTNPLNENEETVTLQDSAGVASTGGQILSESRNYYMIRYRDLAMRTTARDLTVASSFLRTVKIDANRIAADLAPGDVFRLDYPEEGFDNAIMRVGRINYGRPGASTVKINATEDVFSLARPIVETPPGTLFVDPSEFPRPPEFVTVNTMNVFMALNVLDERPDVTPDYPESLVLPMVGTKQEDAQYYVLLAAQSDALGSTSLASAGEFTFVARGDLAGELAAEAQSADVQFTALTQGEGPTVGGLGVIQNEDDEAGQELIMFEASNGAGWTVRRGLLDTVPRAWPVGTKVHFLNSSMILGDPNLYSAMETVRHKALPVTSRGTLSEGQAREWRYEALERLYQPYRPANVIVEGIAFGPVEVVTGDVDITWSLRNRITEDSQPLEWTDAGVAPEDGQTTTIRVLNAQRALVTEYTGLTGESFTLPSGDIAAEDVVILQFFAAREGLESFQPFEVVLYPNGVGTGWGWNWGNDWGAPSAP